MSESAHFGSAFIALNTLGYHFLGSTYDDRTTCLETKNMKAKIIGRLGLFISIQKWKERQASRSIDGAAYHCIDGKRLYIILRGEYTFMSSVGVDTVPADAV